MTLVVLYQKRRKGLPIGYETRKYTFREFPQRKLGKRKQVAVFTVHPKASKQAACLIEAYCGEQINGVIPRNKTTLLEDLEYMLQPFKAWDINGCYIKPVPSLTRHPRGEELEEFAKNFYRLKP